MKVREKEMSIRSGMRTSRRSECAYGRAFGSFTYNYGLSIWCTVYTIRTCIVITVVFRGGDFTLALYIRCILGLL